MPRPHRSEKIDYENTMIIMGAGSHVPYGFPTASQLTSDIKNLYFDAPEINSLERFTYGLTNVSESLEDKIEICRLMQNVEDFGAKFRDSNVPNGKTAGKALDEFVRYFAESRVYSIDSFLAQQSRLNALGKLADERKFFLSLGKLIIAYYILKYERLNKIGSNKTGTGKPDWIDFLFNRFLFDDKKGGKFFTHPPKIYTFNYDTFFERSLIAHLKSFREMTIEAAVAEVDKLNITHIYGRLHSSDSPNSLGILKRSMNDIKVIGEERDRGNLDGISQRIAEQLRSCERLYLLGYGFDALNNEVLFRYVKQDANFPQLQTYSTCVGLDRQQILEIQSDLARYKISVYLPTDKEIYCEQLIKSTFPIFSK